MENSENYILLGNDDLGFYFLHTVFSEDYTANLDSHIYNCLINENMILDTEKICVVWTINFDSSLSTTTIRHDDRKTHIDNNTISLIKSKFKEQVTASHEDNTIVFKYSYDNKYFETYKIPLFHNMTFDNWDDIIYNDNIIYTSTKTVSNSTEN
jgi:hypothetical protein